MANLAVGGWQGIFGEPRLGTTKYYELVGPLGLEPRTKGFTSAPPFPEGVDYLFTPVGCGTL
jgi:hypothetical protein